MSRPRADVKTCGACLKDRPVTDFNRHGLRSDGSTRYQTSCRECTARSAAVRYRTVQQKRAQEPAPEVRKCCRCKAVQAVTEFHRNRGNFSGRQTYCKTCTDKRPRQDPAKARENNLLRNYGVTQAQWDEIFESQGRKCASCADPEPHNLWGWHTDHDHSLGYKHVREIVCNPCNTLFAAARDSVERLEAAIYYLKSWQEKLKC